MKLRLAGWLLCLFAASARAEMPVLPHIHQHAKGLKTYSDELETEFFLTGYAQTDDRIYRHDQGGMPDNDVLLRRVRSSLEADLPDDLAFRLQLEWNQHRPDPIDLYLEKGFGASGVEFRAGRFKPPFASEQLMGISDTFFLERGMVANFFPARDVGMQIDATKLASGLQGMLGLFGGNTDRASSTTDSSGIPELVARTIYDPWPQAGQALNGLSLGISGSLGQRDGGLDVPQLAAIVSPGQVPVFRYRSGSSANGAWARLIPQFFYQQGPVAVLGEWAMSHQTILLGGQRQSFLHHAAQISGSYALTGETPGKRGGINPGHPVTEGGTGAFEATMRGQWLHMDEDSFAQLADPQLSVSTAQGGGVGFGWYPVRPVRVSVNYDYTQFEGGAPSGDRAPEHALFTRLQVRM